MGDRPPEAYLNCEQEITFLLPRHQSLSHLDRKRWRWPHTHGMIDAARPVIVFIAVMLDASSQVTQPGRSVDLRQYSDLFLGREELRQVHDPTNAQVILLFMNN